LVSQQKLILIIILITGKAIVIEFHIFGWQRRSSALLLIFLGPAVPLYSDSVTYW